MQDKRDGIDLESYTNLSIGIVEDDPLFMRELSRRLRECLPLPRIHSWDSAEAFLASPQKTDILFVDIRLPGMSGLALITLFGKVNVPAKSGPVAVAGLSPRIIILSSVNSEETIFQALKLGITGYIYKSELGDLAETLGIILQGGAIISPTIALRVFHSFQSIPAPRTSGKTEAKDGSDELSPREHEVLGLLVEGLTAKEAAEELCISPHTLRTHVKRIYEKLAVRNKAELMRRAGDMGLF